MEVFSLTITKICGLHYFETLNNINQDGTDLPFEDRRKFGNKCVMV